MEYIRIEHSVFDAMLSALADCRSVLVMALTRLSSSERQEWIDNVSAQGILRCSTLSNYRIRGIFGYYSLGGKIIYADREIEEYLKDNYHPPYR